MSEKHTFFIGNITLFVVFFWFGMLKLFDVSPANELVQELLIQTPIMNIWPFESFIVFLGLFEMALGILFLFKKTTKFATFVLIIYIFITTLPLFLLTDITWQSALVPTLEGQYIIKNIVIVALAFFLIVKNK